MQTGEGRGDFQKQWWLFSHTNTHTKTKRIHTSTKNKRLFVLVLVKLEDWIGLILTHQCVKQPVSYDGMNVWKMKKMNSWAYTLVFTSWHLCICVCGGKSCTPEHVHYRLQYSILPTSPLLLSLTSSIPTPPIPCSITLLPLLFLLFLSFGLSSFSKLLWKCETNFRSKQIELRATCQPSLYTTPLYDQTGASARKAQMIMSVWAHYYPQKRVDITKNLPLSTSSQDTRRDGQTLRHWGSRWAVHCSEDAHFAMP